MNRYPLWRYILIVVLIIVGVLYALPNIYGSNPAIQISPKNAAALSDQVLPNVEQTLKQQNLLYMSAVQNKNNILIRFDDTSTQLKAQDVLRALLGDKFSVAPNIAPRTPHWLQAIGAKQMRKGLDLQGGIHFLMAVDTNALLKQQQNSDLHSIGSALREKGVRYSGLAGLGKKGIRIDFRSEAAMNDGLALLNKNFPSYLWKSSDDDSIFNISGQLTQPALVKLQKYAVDQNMQILRNRVNALGVSEPIVVRQGSNNISVDLPGIQDSARAKELLGKTATIELHMVDVQHDAEKVAQGGPVPFGSKLYRDEDGQPILLKAQTVLKGQSIVSASAQIGENGKPIVAIRLGGSGVTLFNRITSQNIGKPMATVMVETKIDSKLINGKVVNKAVQVEKVINTAVIQSALGNSFQIENLQSQGYSRNLALLLRSGAYTAPVAIVQERIVGPSLGKENIKKGEVSTFVGTLLIVLFMAIYYRVFGLVADVALILNLVFIVAILSIIGATLTLPGIAAIVLTLGMAVDANVLINERIREELRLGMSPQAAIAAGYGRAFMTIVDSNVTTLIVAVVLVTISSSSVKGFAVNLIIGLLTSMVTAIFFTRAIVNLTYGNRNVKKLSIGI